MTSTAESVRKIDWFGETPMKWNVKRLKYIVHLVTDRTEEGLPKVGLENIESWTGQYIESEGSFEGLGVLFGVNDILFGKLRPYLAKVYLTEFRGIAVGDFFVLRGVPDRIDPRFVSFLMRSKPFIDVVNSSTFGSKMPRVSWEFMADLPVAFPSLSEQTAIADYLDRKTAEIDQLIADKKRLIELYEEEKTAVINEAVTKGINPDAPMQDSGIEWLGEIPAHWEVIPLTKYLESIVDYRGRTPTKQADGLFLVTARNIKGGIIDYGLSEEYVDPIEASSLLDRGVPKIGDVLFTTEAPLGEVANVDREDIALAQRIIKFRGRRGVLNNYFLKMFLQSNAFQQNLLTYGTGSTAIGIKASKLHKLVGVLPPMQEQEEIVVWLRRSIERIDIKITRTVRLIELLGEYRTALISEVVTGKIKVTD